MNVDVYFVESISFRAISEAGWDIEVSRLASSCVVFCCVFSSAAGAG